MSVQDTLEHVIAAAKTNADFRRKILDTEASDHPYRDFCRICTEQGFTISVMDLVNVGEEYYAAMRRSTNGGGENSPMLAGQDDYYTMLLEEIR